MARPKRVPPLQTGGRLWGPRRVRAGISIRELAERSGLNRGQLSAMENGRLVPSGEEFDRVMAALEAASASPASPPTPGSST